MRLHLALAASLAIAGCDGAMTSDAGSTDAGSLDAGSLDAGSLDAALADAALTDAGPPDDAGASDAAVMDAGSLDAGTDAGATDAGSMDAGHDAAVTDAGPLDAGSLSPEDVCNALCTRLQICTGAGPGEIAACIADCTADLTDCSTPELTTLRGCDSAPDACDIDPATMAPRIFNCIMPVACVMG